MSEVQADAAPSSTEPAAGAIPAGQAVDPATIPPPPPVDNDHVAEGCEPFPEATAAAEPVSEAHGYLDDIEAAVSRVGGDLWTQVRELVAKVRDFI
jgi:hypothetical protein